MQILSHRGFWKTIQEKNHLVAFTASMNIQCGFETDIRDRNSELVISHDPASPDSLPVDALFSAYQSSNTHLPIAINIKADGLQSVLSNLLKQYDISNYFVFDMSVPDTIGYLDLGMNVFMRQSEYEIDPPFYDLAQGIWLDGFKSEWYSLNLIEKHLSNGKKVCIVSPELHKRNNIEFWSLLKEAGFWRQPQLLLCTDYPDKALEYFS